MVSRPRSRVILMTLLPEDSGKRRASAMASRDQSDPFARQSLMKKGLAETRETLLERCSGRRMACKARILAARALV